MKVTDMAVSAVFITTKVRIEVTQDCFVLLGFGPVPSRLGHHSRDGVLLDDMRSKGPLQRAAVQKKLTEVQQSQITIGIFKLQVHVLNMWKIQIGLVGSSGTTVYEPVGGQSGHDQIEDGFQNLF